MTRTRFIPMTLRQANDFVEQHHRHSARTANDGGKFAIGLEHCGELVGVAIVGRPVARLLQKPGTAEILRLCVSPAATAWSPIRWRPSRVIACAARASSSKPRSLRARQFAETAEAALPKPCADEFEAASARASSAAARHA